MRTALYDRHVALGAKMVPFAGWEMPLIYQGVIQEHLAVRERVGLFDVSHMGILTLEGKEAAACLEELSTSHIADLLPGASRYTIWCQEDGGVVDDLIVYCQTPISFFMVVNAANREKDLSHLQNVAAKYNVKVENRFNTHGILALQGPEALSFFSSLQPLKKKHFVEAEREGLLFEVARTGYTGEEGIEVYAPHHVIVSLFDEWIHQGATPCGLGARDTLRLEKGYALYGHELSSTIAPTESVAAWAVKMDKEFIGKQALSRYHRHPIALRLLDPGIAREGALIFHEGKNVGSVTSGTFSPSLKQGIALALTEEALPIGALLHAQVRERFLTAEVVALPFV